MDETLINIFWSPEKVQEQFIQPELPIPEFPEKLPEKSIKPEDSFWIDFTIS